MPANEDHIKSWEGLRNGDKSALFSLYNDLYFHLIRHGLKLTGDDELTKDCVNQMFLNLWEKKDKLAEVSNVRSYLFSILRNIIFDELSYRGKIEHAIQGKTYEEDSGEMSYEDIIISVQHDSEVKEKLYAAIQLLTPRQIELINLKFFEGYTYEQIADKTSQSVKTAYNTIYDAVKSLRKTLK